MYKNEWINEFKKYASNGKIKIKKICEVKKLQFKTLLIYPLKRPLVDYSRRCSILIQSGCALYLIYRKKIIFQIIINDHTY